MNFQDIRTSSHSNYKCRVPGCCETHLSHYCKNCGDQYSNHLSRNCPVIQNSSGVENGRFYGAEPMRESDIRFSKKNQKCRVPDCEENHLQHYCKNCNDQNSSHFSRNCASNQKSKLKSQKEDILNIKTNPKLDSFWQKFARWFKDLFSKLTGSSLNHPLKLDSCKEICEILQNFQDSSKVMNWHNFQGLMNNLYSVSSEGHQGLRNIDNLIQAVGSSKDIFFQSLLPYMTGLILDSFSHSDLDLTVMKKRENKEIILNRKQLAFLMSSFFFGLFPNRDSDEMHQIVNFSVLLTKENPVHVEKLKCI